VTQFRQSVGIAFRAPPPAPRVRFDATEAILEEPTMFDRLCLPALTFTLLASASAALTVDALQARVAGQSVVQLERVVVVARRALPATPVAQAEPLRPVAVIR
jgi:hypothetical protein